MKMLDLIGKVFGRWTVIARAENTLGGQARWLCRCECGNEKILTGHVIRNISRSCGCLKIELLVKRSTKHGHATGGISPTYYTWQGMVRRCTDSNFKSYENYGARGIRVDKRWRCFENFLKDMGERPEGCTIDRIDVNGHYNKSNCRWASSKQQANNKTNNRVIKYMGRSMTLQEWADVIGISVSSLAERLDNWTVEEAVTTRPLDKEERSVGRKKLTARGIDLTR